MVGGKWVVGGGANHVVTACAASIQKCLSVSLENPIALVLRECSSPKLLPVGFGLNLLSQLLWWWRMGGG